MFYELLEGRRPFEAESFSEMCVKVAVDPPAPMVNTPPALQPVILRCLAKVPEQRYATMADLGRDLIPFVQDTHQAQRLVERMQRVLRRSGHTLDHEASGVIARAPDHDSAPVRPWGAGSDPAGAPYAPPVSDRSAPMLRRDPSQPATAVPSTTMTTHRPRRGLYAVIAIGLVAGVGIASAVVLGNRSQEPPARPADHASTAPTPQAAPPPAPVAAPVHAPAPAPELAADPAAKPAGGGSGSATELAVSKPAPKPDQKPDLVRSHGSAIKKSSSKRPSVPSKPESVTPAPEVKDATVKPPAAPPPPKCDPFGSMHGCESSGPSK